ncbi:NPCBM/NEW2 domain-containing protein, partial [Streptomyces mesophilus]|uniref:NPCBM/NEW2 domain-containing protein n=1 Tax=Streptomyces mesophilus TaxID=1775132 RepID=UPI003331B38C
AASGGSGGAAAGGAAAGEGLGAPAKAGIAAAVVVAAGVAVALALAGDEPKPKADPKPKPPPVSQPVVPQKPAPKPPPEPEPPAPPVVAPDPTPTPTPTPPPPPKPSPKPTPPAPKPTPPPPPPAPEAYHINELQYGIFGDGTQPEVRLGESSWIWQRQGLGIAGQRYAHGVTVHAYSSVVIDLNRECTAYDAFAGVDDLTFGHGAVRFSVFADGERLWQSGVVRGGEPAVPVHVDLTGRKTLRLVVEPHSVVDSPALVDWAQSRISCR